MTMTHTSYQDWKERLIRKVKANIQRVMRFIKGMKSFDMVATFGLMHRTYMQVLGNYGYHVD